MSLALVIATYRAGPATEATWDDLRVCLASVSAYARGLEVIVAWDGPQPPEDLPPNPLCRVLARPPGMKSGTAFAWGIEQTSSTELVLLSDDVVLQPDTIGKLLDDAELLRSEGHHVGFLACRSNFAAGPQNIRAANGGRWMGQVNGFTSENTILRAERVSGFCALVTRTASEISGAADVEWSSDDIACFDLAQAGYTHWISRAYVHHIGMRSHVADPSVAMKQLNDEAISWIQANRPDFWQHLQATAASAGNEEPPNDAQPATVASAENSSDRPSLSVVLSATNGAEATIAALQSVLDTCSIVGRIEVIVVDNGSTDATQEVLTALSEDVHVTRLPQPVPSRSAWMEGAARATGQLVLFLSNDVRLLDGFLMPLVRSLGAGGSGAAPILRSSDGDQPTGNHDTQSGLCMLMVRADLESGRALTVSAVPESVVTFTPAALSSDSSI